MRMCTSSNCDEIATSEFDAGGVISVYCDTCRARISGLLHVGPAVIHLPCGGREPTWGTTTIKNKIDDEEL